MQFDTIHFLHDYNIQYIDESSITTARYIGLEECPFCQASGKAYAALGREFNAFSCWICHETDFNGAIQRLTGITNYNEIKKIYKRYGTLVGGFTTFSEKDVVRPTTISLPGKPKLIPNARQYLIDRNFDPEFVWEKYSLRSTVFESKLGYRIVMPIILNGKVISYTARDYTDLQEAKYMSCKEELEIYPHKSSLYNIDFVKGKNCCVNEGPTDSIRIGDGAVASFGTEITLEQIILLTSKFDNIFFLFDGGESEALRHAHNAATIIVASGKNAEVLEMDEGDPDEVFKDEKELIYLRKDLKLI